MADHPFGQPEAERIATSECSVLAGRELGESLLITNRHIAGWLIANGHGCPSRS